MLLSIDHLKGLKIEGLDGRVGHVDSFLFDDRSWHIRYIVVDTGVFIFGNKVLLAPRCVQCINLDALIVNLSVKDIRNSPLIDNEKPISRQKEVELHNFYGWPYYWETSLPFGMMGPPPVDSFRINQEMLKQDTEGDPHLRNTTEIIDYKVNAKQNIASGIIKDLVINTDAWNISFAVMEIKEINEQQKEVKQVPFTTEWIQNILWEKSSIKVNVPEQTLNKLKPFNPHEPINSVYEEVLYDYYGIPQIRKNCVSF